MRAATRTMPKFESRRVVWVAFAIASLAAVTGWIFGGVAAAVGLLLATGLSSAAFVSLEKSLNTVGSETRTLAVLFKSTGRVGLLAMAGIVMAAVGGVAGGVGFLAGILIVKISVVAEGVRSGGN